MNYGYGNSYGGYNYPANPYNNGMGAYNNLNQLLGQQSQNIHPNNNGVVGNPAGGIQNNMQQSGVQYVASIEEVKAHPVDWTGGINYFVDKANNCIYTKQLANDGGVVTNTYRLDTQPMETQPVGQIDLEKYVTREEFDALKGSMNKLLEQLGGVSNEQ